MEEKYEMPVPVLEGKDAARMNIQKSLKAGAIDAVSCNGGYGDPEYAREVFGEAKMAYILGEIPQGVFYEFHEILIVLFNTERSAAKKNCMKRIMNLGWLL